MFACDSKSLSAVMAALRNGRSSRRSHPGHRASTRRSVHATKTRKSRRIRLSTRSSCAAVRSERVASFVDGLSSESAKPIVLSTRVHCAPPGIELFAPVSVVNPGSRSGPGVRAVVAVGSPASGASGRWTPVVEACRGVRRGHSIDRGLAVRGCRRESAALRSRGTL